MTKLNLTPKETIELRIKTLEPFVLTASKHGIEKNDVIQHAEKAWQWIIKTLSETGQTEAPGETRSPGLDPKP